MTLRSAIESELPFLRAEAAATMLDTFAAWSPDGTSSDADGMESPNFATQGSTSGKLGSADPTTQWVTVGGVELPVVVGGIHLPFDAPVPVAGRRGSGWEYELTAVGPSTPAALVGTRWLVVNVPLKSYATALRLDVVQLPPEED